MRLLELDLSIKDYLKKVKIIGIRYLKRKKELPEYELDKSTGEVIKKDNP